MTKRYGRLPANDCLSLDIAGGELAVLLGPNGAGKSTLIKSICGLLRFEGSVTIGGFSSQRPEAKRLLGYAPEFPALYPLLTLEEHLEFIARAYRLKGWESRAEDLLRRFELEGHRKKLGKELSKGMQQKLSVCCALVHEPRAVVFDEPLAGLDPQGIRELKGVMAGLRDSGCAVLVSTHLIETIEESWDLTFIMAKGRILQVCRRGDLSKGEGLEDIYFAITGQGGGTR
jgi:ABC-type multidrug transport system ATPase subunit